MRYCLLIVIAATFAAVALAQRGEAGGRRTGLDPALQRALHRATTDAAAEGVKLVLGSGWRSRAHQRRLFREAVAKYGSKAEASRWVATPKTSAHVKGEAVDIGPPSAAAWLSAHGARYGLCQIYANEPWHFELRPRAKLDGCPPMYTDASQRRVSSHHP